MRVPVLTILVILIATAAVSSSWAGHVDVSDADVYRVIARNMVQDQTWTNLRCVPGAHTPFFEHLPFGFWPIAWALAWFGEFGPNAISAAFSLLVLLIVYRGIRSAGGARARSRAAGSGGVQSVLLHTPRRRSAGANTPPRPGPPAEGRRGLPTRGNPEPRDDRPPRLPGNRRELMVPQATRRSIKGVEELP